MTEELGALPAIEAKLQTFAGDEKDGDDGEVNTAHRHKALRDRQQRLAGDLVDVLRDARGQVTRLRQWLPQRLAEITSSETAGGPNQELVARIQREAVLCNDAVDRFWQQAEARIATAEQAIEDHAQQLSLAHRRQEVAFHELMERHQEAQGQAAERVRLEKARNNLLARRRQRDAVQQELTELRRQRHQLHQRLSELEEQRFNIRESVAGRINAQLAPAIRVNLVQYGDRTLFRQFLEKSLKGHRIHHGVVAGKLADHFWPSELARLVAEEDVDTLVDRGELRCEQAERAVAALSHAETLAELETVELLDQPEIALCDGETYKDCAMLSTGQKCTAILPILLMDSDRPLLVDQPEDNLDNRFVFEAVVDSIRKIKVTRQLIFVTHNPNIPVLGDAERVFVLDSDGARARMAGVGSVDECKNQIVTLLEGGEEAFRQRRARYDY